MKTKLPHGITKTDIVAPSNRHQASSNVPYDDRTFQLWHVQSFGWVIPTLAIGTQRKAAARTYAMTLTGYVVRVGNGPHVLETHTVYVTNARHEALKSFLELRKKGAGDAGAIRDRISSRRAQGQLMRAEGRRSWRWNV